MDDKNSSEVKEVSKWSKVKPYLEQGAMLIFSMTMISIGNHLGTKVFSSKPACKNLGSNRVNKPTLLKVSNS